MPERIFKVNWPDGQVEACYSPSSVIDHYLTAGNQYPLEEFLTITSQGLNEASERVRQKFGYSCSSAMDQLKKIQQRSRQYQSDDYVTVISIGSTS